MSGANGQCPASAGTSPAAGARRNPIPWRRPLPQDCTMLTSKRVAGTSMGISRPGNGSCTLARGNTP